MNPNDELSTLLPAMLDGEMTDAEQARLADLLRDNPQAQQVYLDFCWTHALLRRELGVYGEVPFGAAGFSPPSEVYGNSQLNGEPPFPTLSTTHYPLPTSHFSVGSWAFSYMVATIIMGVAILGFWAYKITHYQHIAEAPSQSAPSEAMPEMVFVGRITGMVDVKWSDDSRYLPPPDFAHVPLDRKYILSSGLLEITYDSGAKVILEGPCTYEVESTAGGYLALGKLTARIGARGEGRGESAKPQAANQKSPSSFILHPSSLFSVRTPTAVVTDLGTEFGVEVDKSGGSKTHVFQGKVEVRLTDGGGEAQAIQLGANESARVEPGTDRIVVVSREASAPGAFVRRMPQWVPIKVFNTGVGLKEGDPDPHWQLVARSDDPDFKPQQAVVTGYGSMLRDTVRSQWISAVGDQSTMPEKVTYTFRTTFELPRLLPNTAILQGKFLVDDHVDAIRLNGRNLDVPEHRWPSVSYFQEFKATGGFVEGTNILEIDVFNGGHQWAEPNVRTVMVCRVELGGSVFSAPATTSDDEPPADSGKEGASMD